MNELTLTLLIASILMLLCVFINRITRRIGMPMLLVFIVLGVMCGSEGVLKVPFDNYSVAEEICTVALIFIMFYGGFGTRWSAARHVAPQAALLSSAGVVLTAGLTGVFCRVALGMDWLTGLLIGSVLGSTDAASVFSILRSKRLNLRDHTASMLEVESGSNDPFAYMLTVTVLSIMQGTASGGQIAYAVFAQIAYGVLAGAAISVLAVMLLKRYRFGEAGFDTIFVFAAAVLAYALPAMIGGNGYLSVYIVGLVLGNQSLGSKRTLVHFFDGFTGLMQMLIFFLLGLLATPSRMPAVLTISLAIALFLTFIGRPLVVLGLLAPFRASWRQEAVVSWAGLRGASSIVFAILATVGGGAAGNDVFHIVFCVVLFSIAFQGSLLPLVSEKLGMLDDTADVMKTFNDYSDESEVQFIRLLIGQGHAWEGKRVREIQLPPETLLVLILRGDTTVLPNGNTVIHAEDTLVLSAMRFSDKSVELSEVSIGKRHRWVNRTIADVFREQDILIVLIRRGGKSIIPNGRVRILEGDTLVLNKGVASESARARWKKKKETLPPPNPAPDNPEEQADDLHDAQHG